MGFTQDYRAFAAQCAALAENVSDANDKARLVYMVKAWCELPDRLEADGRTSVHEIADSF